MTQSLQDRYAPANACFGCGPSNPQGLQLKSLLDGELVVAEWMPAKHHEAFENVLCGGIIGTLLDCHSNWTAAYQLMQSQGLDSPPCTVTAEYAIKLKRPTPTDGLVQLRARVVSVEGDRAEIEATLEAGGKLTATCTGLFVAVREGHPAYHRW